MSEPIDWEDIAPNPDADLQAAYEQIAAKDAEIARLKHREVLTDGAMEALSSGRHAFAVDLATARHQLQEARADAEQAVKIGCDWMNKAARLKEALEASELHESEARVEAARYKDNAECLITTAESLLAQFSGGYCNRMWHVGKCERLQKAITAMKGTDGR